MTCCARFAKRLLTLAATVGMGLLLAAPALAQDSSVKVDSQNFKPSPFFNDGLATFSGEGMEPFAWDAGLVLQYQNNPLVIRSRTTGELTRVIVGNQLQADLMGAFSIFKWLDVGLALPVTLYQDGEGWPDGTQPGIAGIGDLRLVPRLQALNLDDGVFALSALPVLTAPTGGLVDPFMGDKNFSFVPTLAASTDWPWFGASANLSYRFREDQSIGNPNLHQELGYQLGLVGHAWPETVDILAELAGSTPAFEPFAKANEAPLELRGAVRYFGPMGLIFTLGAGSGLGRGYATPAFRVFGGAMFTMVPPKDKDGDGIDDPDDACPDKAEDKDGFEDSDGCPDLDNDKDGVPDVKDGAPNDPEDLDQFEDEDGVPDPDNDKDGILDQQDRCPNQPETLNGVDDDDGCPDELLDSDGDGLADPDDKCPNEPEDVDKFEDEDGCPDVDNDQDGVVDAKDNCPDEVGPMENRGCPDTDRDGDGVVDRLDNCPDEAGSPDNQGCKKKQLVILKTEKIEILKKVYFQTAKATIQKRSYPLLQNVAQVLNAHPEIKKIRVEGHTDDRGKDAYNKDLSNRRAKSVRDFLIKEGIDGSRLEAIGFGEERPIDDNKTKKGRAANRRVEFNIVQDQGGEAAPAPTE